MPPKEEAPNLEKFAEETDHDNVAGPPRQLLDPETQPSEARDGVEKDKAATTDYETDGRLPRSYLL